MENFLKPDKPLLSNVHRTHLQNWGVVSFLSPEDKTKTIIMNSLNDILSGNKVKTLIDNVNDKIMCCLKDEVKKLIKTKQKYYETIGKTCPSDINNKSIDFLKSIDPDNFTFKNRVFTNNVGDLEYKFNVEIWKNKDIYDNEYKKIYGNKVCKRGFKIRGVYNNLNYQKQVKEKITTKFNFKVGYFIPIIMSQVNSDKYIITNESMDEMLIQLNQLRCDYYNNWVKENNEFTERKDRLMNNGNNL